MSPSSSDISQSAIDRLDAERDRERTIRQDRLHHRPRFIHQLAAGTTLFTKPMRYASAASIISPVIRSCIARPLPTSRGKTLRAAVPGKNAELALGLTEFRGIGREPDMTRHRELAPAAEREAVDRRNDRLGAGLESAEHILPSTCACLCENGSLIGELGDVGARDERASGAGENRTADRIVNANLVDRDAQLGDRGIVERVELVGAIDRESGDAVRDLQREEFEGHGEVFVDRFAASGESNAGRCGSGSTAQIYAESLPPGDG